MGDIYDFKSKKKVDKLPPNYRQRYKQCLLNATTHGKCDCEVCEAKSEIASRYYNLLAYLCKDYKERTGNDLYMPDALEIALTVSLKIKNNILKKK